jgi:pyruvate dehydrogenase E1 component alpha subunit
VAVAFFGDGAMNQGMLLESFNLAAAWKLPVLFVCKDNGWAITTRTRDVTGGDLRARAAAFGLATASVDGADPVAVREQTAALLERTRSRSLPTFLHAECARLDGHMAGDLLLRTVDHPIDEGVETARRVWADGVSRTGSLRARASGLTRLMGAMLRAARHDNRGSFSDPLRHARKHLDATTARRAERDEREAMHHTVQSALRHDEEVSDVRA